MISKEKLPKSISGMILLGVIGSIIGAALWVWILQPSLGALGRLVLSVSSLGFHSLKDSVYRQIAKDDLLSLIPTIILGLCLNIVTLSKAFYIHVAIVHYHQALKIAAPYLDPQELMMIESSFAQIRNKQDYVQLLERLEKVSKDHGQNVPAFSAW